MLYKKTRKFSYHILTEKIKEAIYCKNEISLQLLTKYMYLALFTSKSYNFPVNACALMSMLSFDSASESSCTYPCQIFTIYVQNQTSKYKRS